MIDNIEFFKKEPIIIKEKENNDSDSSLAIALRNVIVFH